ncbi:MAG: hypothetical protein KF784_14880 [Fimbriimonadaceae bacterium]|nr:hypothetical protein [Fimbriimonadaceae bacterium]
MLSGALMGLVGGTAVWAVCFVKANAATAGKTVTRKPSLSEKFECPLPPEEVLNRLRQFMDSSVYKVDTTFNVENAVCLTSMPDWKSYGWFHPVYVSAKGSGSLVEVGTTPRYGPGGLPTKKFHEKGVAFVRSLLE